MSREFYMPPPEGGPPGGPEPATVTIPYDEYRNLRAGMDVIGQIEQNNPGFFESIFNAQRQGAAVIEADPGQADPSSPNVGGRPPTQADIDRPFTQATQATERARRGGRRADREPLEGEVLINVRTGSGFPIEIPWPDYKTPEGQEKSWEKMRAILGQIEQTTDPRGGDVNQQDFQDLNQIIQHLGNEVKPSGRLKPNGDPIFEVDKDLRDLGRKMKEEFTARLGYHEVYLKFAQCESGEQIHGNIKDTPTKHIEGVYKIQQKDKRNRDRYVVQEAFAKYVYPPRGETEKAKFIERRTRFINGSKTDKDDVRKEIWEELYKDFNEIPRNTVLTSEQAVDAENKFKYAQNLAERRGYITNKFGVFEGLRYKDPIKDRVANEKAGELVRFDAHNPNAKYSAKRLIDENPDVVLEHENQDTTVGYSYLRRSQDPIEWFYTRLQNERPVMDLLEEGEGGDLFGAKDWESLIAGNMEEKLGNQLRRMNESEFTRWVMDRKQHWINESEKDREAKGYSAVNSSDLFNKGGNSLEDWISRATRLEVANRIGLDYEESTIPDKDKGGDAVKTKWQQGKDLNLADARWDEIDLEYVFGGNAYGAWAYYHIREPDNARGAMVGKAAAFTQNPTADNLASLADVFNYRSGAQYAVKSRIGINFLNFMMSDKAEKILGLKKLTRQAADMITTKVGRKMGLRKKEMDEISKQTVDKSWLDTLMFYHDYVKPERFFLFFIFGIIGEVFKQGMSTKV